MPPSAEAFGGVTVTQRSAEVFSGAARRALPLIIILCIVDAVFFNVLRQAQGPLYSATARVLLSTTDFGAVVTGFQPTYVDPDRVMENALLLARSQDLYRRAAEDLNGVSGSELRAMTTVGGSDDADLLFFTAESSNAEFATAAANAVAAEFPIWRSEVSAASVRQAIERLRSQLSSASGEEREALRVELRRLEVLETLTTGNTVLVERATSADRVRPAPVRDSIMGAALGVMIALLISGFREIFDTRIRSETEAEEFLDAPNIATLAPVPKRAKLVTIGRYEERFGDAYALLAASVSQMNDGKASLVIAVTSASKEQGKTITAANLAVAMAQRGSTVILADFDLRRPSVAPLFKIHPESPGLVQALRDGVPFESVVRPVPLSDDPFESRRLVRRNGAGSGRTTAGSLYVVPAGGAIRNLLSHSPRVGDLIQQFSRRADVVIIDTPPALATPDMAQLSRLVDVVLVVVRQGRESRRSLRALHRQSQSWQKAISGVVVTDSDADDAYGYYAARSSART